MTPFEVVYGRKPPSLLCLLVGETQVESVANILLDRDEALRQLKFHLHPAQQSMKRYVDAHRRPLVDSCLLYLPQTFSPLLWSIPSDSKGWRSGL